MIITCPACEAQYILPDDSIGEKGRRVKCTSCAYTWLQAPVVEETAKVFDAEIIEDKPRSRPVLDPRQVVSEPAVNTKRAALMGVAGGLAFFVFSVGFMLVIREGLAAGWPPSALLFEKVGLETSAAGTGLALEEATAELLKDKAPALLTLKGKITNTTAKEIALPKLLVRSTGEKGWLKDWPIDLYGKIMPAGESVSFEYTLQDAPTDSKDVTVRFTY